MHQILPDNALDIGLYTAPAPEYWNKGGHGQFGGGAHGERVEREPITGVWGRSP